MIRNGRRLGLVFVAMFALGALFAHGASASPLTSVSSGKTYLTGDQDGGVHTFTTPHGTVKCQEASFSAVANEVGSINELTVVPSYPTFRPSPPFPPETSNCSAFGFPNTHVKTNGCKYTFTTPTQVEAGKVTWTGSKEQAKAQVHLVGCDKDAEGKAKKIEITPTSFGASVCTQYIAEQTPTEGHVIGKNAGSASEMDVTLEIALKGIHYTGTGGVCTDGTTHTDATLTGNSTVKCYSNEGHTIQVSCTFS